LVAGITTILSTSIGTLAALALGRFNFRGKGLTQAGLFLPIVIPEIVLGAGARHLFWRRPVPPQHLDGGWWRMWRSASRMSPSWCARASRGLTVPWKKRPWIWAPVPWKPSSGSRCRSSCRVSWRARSLVFTISIDDYVITSFVAGVGATTLPLQIYSMIKVGVTPEVNAVSTLLLLLTILMIVVAQRLQQEPGQTGEKK
jgi:spermidine/putrescine transport system permease protein